MLLLDRIKQWGTQGLITESQTSTLSALVSRERFSVFLELNALLYLGVISFIGGLGWTINTYFKELGTIAIIFGLSAMLIACLTYTFKKAKPYSSQEVESSNLALDYVLYLGCLVWSVELGYLENRFHLSGGQWSIHLLLTAIFFFALAYRFDNRFVLSLALSSLAGWFGLKGGDPLNRSFFTFRFNAIMYGLLVGGAGLGLTNARIKSHFQNTFLNFAANAMFWAALSGIFNGQGNYIWFLVLLVIAAVIGLYGVKSRQFIFVAYSAVYTYMGASYLLMRLINEPILTMFYFTVTGALMLALLFYISRQLGSES